MAAPIFLLLPWFLFTQTVPRIERRYWLSAAIYSVSHGFCTLTLYSSVNYIPVGTARALFYTGKMICNVILFCGFKGEKATISKIISVLICIVGSVLMIQPPPLFSGNLSTAKLEVIYEKDDFSKPHSCIINITDNIDTTTEAVVNQTASCIVEGITISNADDITFAEANIKPGVPLTYSNALIGIALTFIASICAGAQGFVRRTTTLKEVATAPLTWWTYMIGVAPSTVCMFIAGHLTFPTDTNSLLLINAHVLTAFATKLFGIFSGARASGVILTIVQYSGLVMVMLAQYTVLKDINPGHR